MGGAMCALTLLLGCAAKPPIPVETAPSGPYRIGTGDTLEIIVWHETQLSGPVQVRADGMITVALIGDIAAAGSTSEKLADDIRQGLVRFVDSPNVSVKVVASGRRFFIMGNVRTPGSYELRPEQTFLQALAMAGGFTEFASRGSVRIIRAGKPPVEPDYNAIVRGAAADIPLEPNDTIVVP